MDLVGTATAVTLVWVRLSVTVFGFTIPVACVLTVNMDLVILYHDKVCCDQIGTCVLYKVALFSYDSVF